MLVIAGVVGAPATARADVTFDRAFGIAVRTGAFVFENCTAATGCHAGVGGVSAGSPGAPAAVAIDAQGRILVAAGDRISRFLVAGDGTVSFDRAFGTGVATGGTAFENCTVATGCETATPTVAAGGMRNPMGVAVDGQGRIVVADNFSKRIDVFSPGPTVTVSTVVSPATDPGTFDLRVDSVVVRVAAANGQSGSLQVADGAGVTISERAVTGRLSDYDTTIDCGGGPKPGTSLKVTVTANLNCTIRNTRSRSGPKPPVDTTPPVFTSASLTNRIFAVDRRGVPETAVTAAAKKGTTFRYTLSESARVLFTANRATVGRKVGGKCRKPARSNRQRRRCTRYRSAGRFAVPSAAGANEHPFSGRIGRRSLTPGRYRVTLVAIDAAGNRSAARRLSLKVVKR